MVLEDAFAHFDLLLGFGSILFIFPFMWGRKGNPL